MYWISTDFKQQLLDLSPTFFRGARFEAFLGAFAKPLQTLADTTLYQMQHDSRVIYLEKLLNEYLQVSTYNPNSHIATRQVYIVDAPQVAKTYIYQPEEEQPIYLGQIYLDRENEVSANFIIKIPSSISFDELRLRALIDFYKLSGKKYIIQTY
jgi:hypothetical protein